MTDTAAALVIQLTAETRQFQKDMRAATGVFDAEGRKIEKRQAQLKKSIQDGFSGLGKYIAGGAALYGIERFVSSIVDAGSKIKDTSDAIGVGTDEIQAWGLMAERSGTSQEDFNSALEKFSKNLGDAAIKGGDAAKLYRKLGIDLKAGPTDGFYQLADAVQKTRDPQQQVAVVTAALGKSAAKLTPILAQGSAALRAQTAQMVASGQVIKHDAIDKLDDLGDAWTDLKRQFLAVGGNALAEPLSKITESLKDPQVQSGLKAFADILAQVAIEVAKVAKYAPVIAGMWAGAKIGRLAGPLGAAGGAVVGGIAGKSIQDVINGPSKEDLDANISQLEALFKRHPGAYNGTVTEKRLAQLKAQRALFDVPTPTARPGDPKKGGIDRSDLLGGDSLKQLEGQNQIAEMARKDAAQTRDAVVSANDDIRKSHDDANAAARDSLKAQDDAMLQLAQGTEDYYGLQKQVIAELASLDIDSVNDRKVAELTALSERTDAEEAAAKDELSQRKQQLAELVAQEKISQKDANKSLDELKSQQATQRTAREQSVALQSVDIENQAATAITAINAKKNADLVQADEDYFHTKQNLIEINDGIRQGLIDIGTAGLKGFGSLKDAAASALEQIAQMILQMYVLKPLVESLLGKSGTAGGGILGGLLSSIPGFANGTNSAPGGIALVGERGPELVNLPRGSQVIPNISRGATGAGALMLRSEFNINVTGTSDKELLAQMRAGVNQALTAFDKSLPSKVAYLTQNPLVR